MLTIRRSKERGQYKNAWLDSRHSFSFGEYYDPRFMGASLLRVINEDWIKAGAGFPTHPHNNMEIITYVMEGALAHKDSMGNGSEIKPDEVQHMSAGSGITHSEFNPSADVDTHLLQIWLLPEKQNIKPVYSQQKFTQAQKHNQLALLASPTGKDSSIAINSDSLLFGSLLDKNEVVNYALDSDRIAYLHLVQGGVKVNGQILETGDAATIKRGKVFEISARENAEFLLFDLPA